MSSDRPVEMNALSVTAAIVVFKAFMNLAQTMGWIDLDAEKNAALIGFVDIAFPIIFVWAGVWWTKRNVTPLAKPQDVDGTSLSRPGDMPAIKEMANLQERAIAIDKEITRGLES